MAISHFLWKDITAISDLFFIFWGLQDMMEALTTQNSELRAMLIKATEVKKHKNNDNGSEDGTSLQHDDLVCSHFINIFFFRPDRLKFQDHFHYEQTLVYYT